MADHPFIPRHIERTVRERLAAFRVVVLHGARQTGKTTLVRLLNDGGSFVSLDDQAQRNASIEDPRSFIEIRSRPVIIDEVQRGGDALVREIKIAVDADPAPGAFLLTGSANFLTVPHLSESLAGRASFVDLGPLSETERERTDGLLAELLSGNTHRRRTGGTAESTQLEDRILAGRQIADHTPREYAVRVARGGYPALTDISERLRSIWFDDYIRAVIARDVRELTGARKVDDLPRLLEAVAARTASELVVEDLRRDLGFGSRDTTADYLAHLRMLYLVRTLPGWAASAVTRARRRPKIYLTDTGLAASALSLGSEQLLDPAERMRGALLETFVVNELAKQSSFADEPVALSHFRSPDGRREIDVIAQAADGRVFGFEVKAGRSVNPRHYRNLAWMRDAIGAEFALGIVLYTGDVCYRLADRIVALPISTLWSR